MAFRSFAKNISFMIIRKTVIDVDGQFGWREFGRLLRCQDRPEKLPAVVAFKALRG